MSSWPEPSEERSEQDDLRELSREGSTRRSHRRRWCAIAFAAGVMLVAALGLGTEAFDSGPTEEDVSAAYREAFDEATAVAAAEWEERLDAAWWDAYWEGQNEESQIAAELQFALERGFSWDAAYEIGLSSSDVDLDERYRQGWMDGYRTGWSSVTGEELSSGSTPSPPSPGLELRAQWTEPGDLP